MEMTNPDWLEGNPKPRLVHKSFHGRKVPLWEGVAKVERVYGWVKNPRLDLELKRFQDDHAGRDPSNDEILTIMTSVREFGVKDLADDIRSNGVRQPIILGSDGKLLDGNRRFYAVMYVLSKTDVNDPSYQDFTKIPVWVLDETCTHEDEQRILVQENFYPALKVEWPDYVKARYVYDDLTNGIPAKSVGQKYNWSTAKVNETKKIMDLIGEFVQFATTPKDEEGLGVNELEAERLAAERYQQFNEAQKSFLSQLSTDFDFKIQFFKWVYEGKFSSFQEVRVAWEGWKDPNVRRILLSDDPESAKKARAEVEYKKVVKSNSVEAAERINEIVKFLEQLTAAEIASLPDSSIDNLRIALATVGEMGKAAKKNAKD